MDMAFELIPVSGWTCKIKLVSLGYHRLHFDERILNFSGYETQYSREAASTSFERFWTYLLQDFVDVDLVGLHGLDLLLAGASGCLLDDLLCCRSFCCGSLHGLFGNLGSHSERLQKSVGVRCFG